MPEYRDKRHGRPLCVRMTVVGDTYVICAPTPPPTARTQQSKPTRCCRLWRSLPLLASIRR